MGSKPILVHHLWTSSSSGQDALLISNDESIDLPLPLKFPPKYYIIKQNDDVEKKAEFPLSFLTPDGVDESAEKRKDTGRRWARGYYYYNQKASQPEEFSFDNVPVQGFQIVDTVSRSTTDNKVFRVYDPRKFSCEISSYNLFDIIANDVIDHGVVQGHYVWGRDGQQNRLIPASDKDYLESLKPKEDYTPKIGDHIKSQKVDGVIAGTYYLSRITTLADYETSGHLWQRTFRENLVLAYDNTPWLVIDESDTEHRWQTYTWVRKIPKNYIVVQKQKAPNPLVKQGEYGLMFFHKTREEQEAFNPTEQEIRTLYYDKYVKPKEDKYDVDRYNKYGYGGKVLKPECI